MISNSSSRSRNVLLWAGCLLAGIVVYHVCYGLDTLAPSRIDWLMQARHDWGTHYLGWYFYRNEPWMFPLGNIQHYYFPIGTNVGFTDSIPLLAIFFKIFAPVLPEDFQYFGLWMLSCLLLTGYFGAKILKRFGASDGYVFLGFILIMCNPVLVYRALHPALCGHWILLAGIYYYSISIDDEVVARKSLRNQYVVLLLSALVNPYLCLMSFGFTLIIPVRQYLEKKASILSAVIYLGVSIVSVGLVWYLVGMLGTGSGTDLAVQSAYGLYSLNLNALFNGSGFSALLPMFPSVSWHQYEGFMYLGVGMIILVLATTAILLMRILTKENDPIAWAKKRWRTLAPISLLALLLAAFAITNIISFNDAVLLRIPLPSPLTRLGDIFRASARFFWIPYYMMLLGVLVFFARTGVKDLLKILGLVAIVFIQIYDIEPLMTHRTFMRDDYAPPIDSKKWSLLMSGFDNIILYPPFLGTYKANLDYQDFSFVAAKDRKRITTGYVARGDNRAARYYTDSLDTSLSDGAIDGRSLFVTTGPYLDRFSFLLQSGAAEISILDGYYLLYSPDRKSPEINGLIVELNRDKKDKRDSVLNLHNEFNPLKKMAGVAPSENVISYNFDKYSDGDQFTLVSGWAFASKGAVSPQDSVFIFLKSADNLYIMATTRAMRPDVSGHFKRSDLDGSGFSATIKKNSLPKGVYKIGLSIKDQAGKTTYQLTNRETAVGVTAEFRKLENPVIFADIEQNVDLLEDQGAYIKIAGWALFKGQDTDGAEISLVLKADSAYYVTPVETMFRPDVTTYFRNGFNLDNSGYTIRLKKSALPHGEYAVGIYIKDGRRNKEGLVIGKKTIKL